METAGLSLISGYFIQSFGESVKKHLMKVVFDVTRNGNNVFFPCFVYLFICTIKISFKPAEKDKFQKVING